MYNDGITSQRFYILIGCRDIAAELRGCFPRQHPAQFQIGDPHRTVFFRRSHRVFRRRRLLFLLRFLLICRLLLVSRFLLVLRFGLRQRIL